MHEAVTTKHENVIQEIPMNPLFDKEGLGEIFINSL